MVKTNDLLSTKVLSFACLLILLNGNVAELSAHVVYKTPRDKWVDSIYHSLNHAERIRQLLFPIMDPGPQIISGFGGVISTGNTPIDNNEPSIPVLRGALSGLHRYIHLDVDAEALVTANSPELFEGFGYHTGNNLGSNNYDFALVDRRNPGFHQIKQSIDAYSQFTKGITKSGIQLWDDAATLESMTAIELNSYLKTRGKTIANLSKKDIRKITKTKPRDKLIFNRIDSSDPNIENGILLADALIIKGSPQEYEDIIRNLLKSRKLKKKTFERRVKKILALKYGKRVQSSTPHTDDIALRNFKRKLNERSVVIIKNQDHLLPIRRLDNRNFASLGLGAFSTLDPFRESLSNYTFFGHYDETDFLSDQDRLFKTLSHYDHVIVGFSFPEEAAVNNQDVLERIQFLELLSMQTNVIVVVFGVSKWIDQFATSQSVVFGHDNQPAFQHIIPQIIFGALSASGKFYDKAQPRGIMTEPLNRLKYTTPEIEGFDHRMELKIDFIVEKAIENFATPGCQILVARNGSVVLNKSYGYHTYDSLQKVDRESLYDLASVTKVAGTLQATMFLEGRKELNLDAPLSAYLPELSETNKEDLIIRKVLTHQAGLRPYFPFYRKTLLGDRPNPDFYQFTRAKNFKHSIGPGLYGHQALEDSVWNWTINSSLRKKPEWKIDHDYAYSDLGFLIMYKLNERLLNQPMDEFLTQNFYHPLGMNATVYRPLCFYPLEKIAPTELDYDFRNALVWGMVHDENAALTGGVSGHAGLFSNANDLAKLFQMNLQDGYYGGTQYFVKGTLDKFTRKQFPGNRRGLGWDRPAIGTYQNTARQTSSFAYGHLGFTGTAVWVDPKYDLIYIFLSNRVHPNRENDKLMVDNIRSRIHEVIYESMPEFRQGS